MTLLWLLSAGVMAEVAIWSGQKVAPSMAYAFVMLGLALGWIEHTGPIQFVAHEHGNQVHNADCIQVKNAEGLRHFHSLDSAIAAGLTPHQCLSQSHTYTVSTPHKNPATNANATSIASPQGVSARSGTEL